MALKVYIDHFSQPSRAVLALLELNNISYELKETRISKNQHKTPEFRAINPFESLPAIQDGDLHLIESHAIMRYLCRSKDMPDHWYPKDPVMAAKINSYLDWHHLGTRTMHIGLGLHVNNRSKYPSFSKMEGEVERIKKIFNRFNDYWIKSTPFILGTDMSIADLSAFSEIITLLSTDFSFKGEDRMIEYLHGFLKVPAIKKSNGAAFRVFQKINPAFESRLDELGFALSDFKLK